MGLMNNHQVLPGARTRGGLRTYSLAGVIEKPEVTVTTDTVTFDSGLLEVDGSLYPLATKSLDFGNFVNLLVDGRDYVIAAVPSYFEPLDRTSAESANPPANYFVTTTTTNETVLNYFMPSAIEAAVTAAGGANALQKRVMMGSASSADITLYNSYSEALERTSDPRFVGRPLYPNGIEFILAGVYDQDNRSKLDATSKYSETDFKNFLATQGDVLVNRKVMTLAAANTAYANKLSRIKRAHGYSSEANANNDVESDRVELNPSKGYAPAKRQVLAGNPPSDTLTPQPTHVAVYEYFYPSYMFEGHEGTEAGVYEFLTKEMSASLGRINPIYLNNPLQIARTMIGHGPKTALMHYADPTPLLRVGVTITPASGGNPASVTLVKKDLSRDSIVGLIGT